jgi:hypothetical protein
MINWRMVGVHVGRWLSPLAGTIATLLGSLATLAGGWPLTFTRARRPRPPALLALFGLMAATLALTWHSHQHMALLLLPGLLLLLRAGDIPTQLFMAWILVPPFSYLAVIGIVILIVLNILPPLGLFGGLLTGGCLLAFNLLFLYRCNLNNEQS